MEAKKASLIGLLLYIVKSDLVTDSMCYQTPTDNQLIVKNCQDDSVFNEGKDGQPASITPNLPEINAKGTKDGEGKGSNIAWAEKIEDQEEEFYEAGGMYLGDKFVKYGSNQLISVDRNLNFDPSAAATQEPYSRNVSGNAGERELGKTLGELMEETANMSPQFSTSQAASPVETVSVSPPKRIISYENNVLGCLQLVNSGEMFNMLHYSKIGRGDNCQVVLNDLKVSRVHAVIKQKGDDDVVLEVMSKKNCLLVNEVVVTSGEVMLNNKDTITIKNFKLIWEKRQKVGHLPGLRIRGK